MTLGNAAGDDLPEPDVASTSFSALVTVSSKLVTGPLTLMICVLMSSSFSCGLSNLEAGGEDGTSRMDSLDLRRPPTTPPAASAGLLTVITVDVGAVGDVGFVEVEDLEEDVIDDLDSLGVVFGDGVVCVL